MKFLKTMSVGVLVCVTVVGTYQVNVTDNDAYIELDGERVLLHDEVSKITSMSISGKENAALREKIFDADTDDTSSVMRKIFSLQTSTPFNVNLPNSSQSVDLTHFIGKKTTKNEESNNEFAVGDYQDGEVKGSVLLDYYHITPLNFAPVTTDINSHKALFTFIVPFVVTTQGSGASWYLGLFNIDYKTHALTHLSSVFVGDKVITIEPENPFTRPYHVSVSYRDRNQATPMEKSTLLLTVSKTRIVTNHIN